MKKLFILVLCLLVLSCAKEDNNTIDETSSLNLYDKINIEHADLSKQLEYKRFHVKKIISWLIKHNKEVRDVVNEVKKKNSAQERFYVKMIVDKISNFKKIKTDQDLEFALNAFTNLDGENWYPVIYFHDFERKNVKVPFDSLKTLYATSDYDTAIQEQITIGYQENSNGELTTIDETLQEGMADENDVIILDLIPCTGTGGQQQYGACSGGGGGNTPPPPPPPNNSSLHYIDKMTVKYHKESWPERSDVKFVGFKLQNPPVQTQFCGFNFYERSCTDVDGDMIKKFKWRWVNNETEKTVNFRIDALDPPAYGIPLYFNYVIFEQDSWPAPKNEARFYYSTGSYAYTEYRSWQVYYHKVSLSYWQLQSQGNQEGFPWLNGYSVDINPIKYNLTIY